MSYISNSILGHYEQNFDQLTPVKQFHFAARMHLWSQTPSAQANLERLRPWYVAYWQEKPDHGSKRFLAIRQQYFERYSQLDSYLSELLKVNFMQSVYEVDRRAEFSHLFPPEEVEKIANDLLSDREALIVLSSHAVNFLYLYYRLIKGDETALLPDFWLEIGKTYDLSDPLQVLLKVYLYTHCIIGESLFYYRSIGGEKASGYEEMLQELDEIIEQQFEAIKLDNKFEFLVCAKLVGYSARSEQRIVDEAGASVSKNGNFLEDPRLSVNCNPATLESAEHRSVLFIMSQTEFSPLGITA